MNQHYYVQVRYSKGREWVTVSRAETRKIASTAAATACGGLHDARDEIPNQCRVVSAGQLVREGGQRGLRRVDTEIAQRTGDP